VIQTSQGQLVHLAHVPIALGGFPLAQLGPQAAFHDVEAAEDGACRQEAVGDLVEDGVFCVEVVDLDVFHQCLSKRTR
jgi:hypothetical protein